MFGAAGYTGKLAAEHITRSWPTIFKWAIDCRRHSKLSAVIQELESINADRLQPAIEVADLKKEDLHALAKKMTVLINTVGPYSRLGEPVVEACAANGTHYLDVTGESPWVAEMVQKYHEKARASGSIVSILNERFLR